MQPQRMHSWHSTDFTACEGLCRFLFNIKKSAVYIYFCKISFPFTTIHSLYTYVISSICACGYKHISMHTYFPLYMEATEQTQRWVEGNCQYVDRDAICWLQNKRSKLQWCAHTVTLQHFSDFGTSFRPGINIWCDPITSGQLYVHVNTTTMHWGRMWPHSFSSVNAVMSWDLLLNRHPLTCYSFTTKTFLYFSVHTSI